MVGHQSAGVVERGVDRERERARGFVKWEIKGVREFQSCHTDTLHCSGLS